MKEKIAVSIILIILACFIGFLFLRGESVINGQTANNFKLIAFANNYNTISDNDLSGLDIFIDVRRSGTENAKIEFYINDKLIDEIQIVLDKSTSQVKPTEKILSTLQKNGSQDFEYQVKAIWEEKESDQIKKTISIKR